MTKEISYLIYELGALYHQVALRLQVSDSILVVMDILLNRNGQSLLSDIYKLSGISKQTINSAIRELENRKLIVLKRHDGRSKIVALTKDGQEYAQKTAGLLHGAEIAGFKSWEDEEIATYIRLLKKHYKDLQAEVIKM